MDSWKVKAITTNTSQSWDRRKMKSCQSNLIKSKALRSSSTAAVGFRNTESSRPRQRETPKYEPTGTWSKMCSQWTATTIKVSVKNFLCLIAFTTSPGTPMSQQKERRNRVDRKWKWWIRKSRWILKRLSKILTRLKIIWSQLMIGKLESVSSCSSSTVRWKTNS